MKTAKEREAHFRRELAELLQKHGAELQVTDDGRPYGMHSGVCRISMDGKWDADGEPMEECAEFDL